MPVRPQPQEHEVKSRHGRLRAIETVPQGALIGERDHVGIALLDRHAMDVCWRDGHAREERVARHPKVALRVIRRHAPLIAPEHVDRVPGDQGPVRLARQECIERCCGGPAGECDAASAARADLLTSQSDELLRRLTADRVRIRKDADLRGLISDAKLAQGAPAWPA